MKHRRPGIPRKRPSARVLGIGCPPFRVTSRGLYLATIGRFSKFSDDPLLPRNFATFQESRKVRLSVHSCLLSSYILLLAGVAWGRPPGRRVYRSCRGTRD